MIECEWFNSTLFTAWSIRLWVSLWSQGRKLLGGETEEKIKNKRKKKRVKKERKKDRQTDRKRKKSKRKPRKENTFTQETSKLQKPANDTLFFLRRPFNVSI